MRFAKATVTLGISDLQEAIDLWLKAKGLEGSNVRFRTFELTDRGPTTYEATVDVESLKPLLVAPKPVYDPNGCTTSSKLPPLF